MLHLAIVNSEDDSRHAVDLDSDLLHGDGVIIGRAAGCGVRLDHGYVSRSHARLHLLEGVLQVTDLGSTSGTFVNGEPVPSAGRRAIPDEGLLTIGPFQMTCGVTVGVAAGDDDQDMTMVQAPPMAAIQPVADVADDAWQRWPAGALQVRCVRIIQETPDVKTFTFCGEAHQLFTYQPGQFATLQLEIDGQSVARSYTISSSPSRPHSISVTVKRVPAAEGHQPGRVSNWLHDHLELGQQITIAGPYGDFSSHRHPNPRLCLLSAGSGITPMLSMVRWHADTVSNVDIVFVHVARSAQDLVCRRELEDLAAHHPHLRLVFALSRPQPTDAWSGHVGRLSNAMLREAVGDLDQREVFVCGPAPFMVATRALLADSGFPMDRYHEESFGGPASSPAKPGPRSASGAATSGATADENDLTPRFGLKAILRGIGGGNRSAGTGDRSPPTAPAPTSGAGSDAGTDAVVLSASGRTLVTNGQSILEAAEAAGLSLPCACRMGKCGTCKAVLTTGAINTEDYDDSVLSDADRESGFILTCIARPAGQCEVDA